MAGGQIDNAVGDLEGNTRKILDAMAWAEEREADVLVLPELALTGYPLEDLSLRREFLDATNEALGELARASGAATTVVGTLAPVPPRRGGDVRLRNVAVGAALLCDGEVRGIYHKVLLPNYEVFDEARYFAAGERPGALWRIGGCVAGVAVCEDLWSGDGPPELQAAGGAQVLLVPNASPFNRGKPSARLELTRSVARRNGVPVVYVNCVGGQDELVFDGGSLVVDGDGSLRYRAPQFEPTHFCVDVPVAPRPSPAAVRTVHARVRPARALDPPPPSAPEEPETAQVWRSLVLGTRDFAGKNGLSAAVLGLSGGIDSAVTAAVAADALGAGNVIAVAMPGRDAPPEGVGLAERVAGALGLAFRVVPIEPVIAALGAGLVSVLESRPAGLTRQDLEARTRGAILWAISDELGHLALATGNKTELSVGSAALHGDMAGAFAPLKDCPKTLLYELARHRNEIGAVIPEEILESTPSAQDDGGTAPPPYELLDPIVERYVEKGDGLEEIVAAGYDPAVARGVLQLVDDAELERRQTPPGVKITPPAFGRDRRMPISSAWRPFRSEEAEMVGGEPAVRPVLSAARAEGEPVP